MKVTPQEALDLLQNDVVLSKAFATEEVDRYTFRSPGQAVSYFDGYTRLREIRKEAEKAQGSGFDAQKFTKDGSLALYGVKRTPAGVPFF